ncbi:uncharacterized protein [Diadema antillarum]|uniref:uncharacterized protein n=1 Tax=Diadema antillarum TaxID=105358 RepID=UPI003A86B0E2
MSFVRVPRRSQSLSGKSRKKQRRLPKWDDTTSDLTVHKLNREELERRHKVHQSSNIEAVREQLRRQALIKARKERSQSEGSQVGLLREILYDEKQLNDALAHSDRVMSVVKDLFYDDPKRLRGMPNVTRAPGADGEIRRAGPIREAEPHTSHLDVLSDSIMDPHALNDMEHEEEASGDETDVEHSGDEEKPVFDSKLDIDRFQSYISKASDQFHSDDQSRLAGGPSQQRPSNKENYDPNMTPSDKADLLQDTRAINDTAKVKNRMRSRVKSTGQRSQDVGHKTRSEDLAACLNELMRACSELERKRGEGGGGETTAPLDTSRFSQLSGYTSFLVQTLTKVLTYLSDTESRLQQQEAKNQQLEGEILQNRELIDAMTVDMIQSQELSMKIQSEARLQINQLERRLQIVEHLMVNSDFAEGISAAQPSAKEPGDLPENGQSKQQAVTSVASSAVPSPGAPDSISDQGKGVGETEKSKPTFSSISSIPAPLFQSSSLVTPSISGAPHTSSAPLFTGENQTHLSQHTIDRLMNPANFQSSEPVAASAGLEQRSSQEKEHIHVGVNIRKVQTNIPFVQGGLTSDITKSQQLKPTDPFQTQYRSSGLPGADEKPQAVQSLPAARTSSTNSYSGGGAETFAGTSRPATGADATVGSGINRLHPIQPAMLLSPPRQKDRRDFIRPQGYQQTMAYREHAPNTGAAGSRGSNTASAMPASGPASGPASRSAAVPIMRPAGIQSGQLLHPNASLNQTGAPPFYSLNNQARPAQTKLPASDHLQDSRQTAPSVLSLDSSSTRYLSLPSQHREAVVIKNILKPELPPAGEAHQDPLVRHRPGPNGQDHSHPPQAGDQDSLRGLDSESADGTVEANSEIAAELSVDMNEKIAALSRQRAEAQARLQQLKNVHTANKSIDIQQRPSTSGAGAPPLNQVNGTSYTQAGVLLGASPPVSPIPREPPAPVSMATQSSWASSKGRAIHVSLPKLDDLEISATSTPASRRTSFGSDGPSPSIDQINWKTPLKDSHGEEEFFALKAHISS